MDAVMNCLMIGLGIYLLGVVIFFFKVLFGVGPNSCAEYIIIPLTWPLYFLIKGSVG